MENGKDIALVLSGGGARGLAHIGVIEELVAQGYNIKSITGTSMGALIGGIYAMGKMDDFKEWVQKLNKYSVFRLMDFSFRNAGFLKGERVLNTLRLAIPGGDIEELNIPYRAIATDIQTQQSVILDSGNIYDAIRASIAIPTVFTPIVKDDMILVDGGVLNNIPIDYAIRTSASDRVVAVNVNARTPYNGIAFRKAPAKLGVVGLSTRVISLMIESIGNCNLKEYPADFMINVSRFSCELYEFYRAKEQIEYGRKCAKEQLKNYH